MPLLFADSGREVQIKKIGGDSAVKQHLNELGFNVGSPVTVISKVSTGIIVKVKDCRLALDKYMASKIIV
ncbi:MAG: ferrous iron transport protein A [Treponema sp.]|nr:ferrous iron transport protein A [Treponema sp.]